MNEKKKPLFYCLDELIHSRNCWRIATIPRSAADLFNKYLLLSTLLGDGDTQELKQTKHCTVGKKSESGVSDT